MKTKSKPTPAAPPPPKRFTVWEDGGIGHPCGHESSFAAGCWKMDHFCCPVCGLRWHMQQAPPTVYPSGWVQPGKRIHVLESQMELPALTR